MAEARKKKRRPRESLPILGWREWIVLPDLTIPRIKVKVDTGARTSALHAFDVEPLEIDGKPWVRFRVHPIQRDARTTVQAQAPLVDERRVRSSSGKATWRPVVSTRIVIGGKGYPIELTLVRRDLMGFRMLLGRQAIRGKYLVDPRSSYLAGKIPPPKKKATHG